MKASVSEPSRSEEISKIRSPKAITLIGVIIAFYILAMVGVTTAILVRESLQGDKIVQSRTAAQSFARGGIDAVKVIRNTNQLLYGADENCWNTLNDEIVDISNCDENLIQETYYTLKLDLEDNFSKLYLEQVAGDRANTFNPGYQIYECTLADAVFYANSSYANPEANNCISTDFYRQIQIEYEMVDGSPANPENAEMMVITSTVSWIADGRENTFSITEDLNRY